MDRELKNLTLNISQLAALSGVHRQTAAARLQNLPVAGGHESNLKLYRVVDIVSAFLALPPPVAEGVCRQLEALCEETIVRAWQSGTDLLRLGAVRALKEGPGAFFTTKNACPEVRASVKMLDL